MASDENGNVHKFPMMQNRLPGGGGVPPAQLAPFECDCGERFFKLTNGVLIYYDRLDPKNHRPVPASVYECAACGGIVQKQADGSLKIVHAKTKGDD